MGRGEETNGMCRTCVGASYNLGSSIFDREYEHMALTEDVFYSDGYHKPID